MPQPTEHRLDGDAEARHKLERRRWMESMHRAAPDVDWRAIERENGRREQERRNQLAASPETATVPRSWVEVGSENLAGRMHCAAIGPDGETLYGGSALGGVWRAPLDGNDWEPLGDNLYGGAHELLVLPGEEPGAPDVIIAATDWGQVRVSRDLGASWEQPSGLTLVTGVRGLAVLQDPARTILLLVQQNLVGNTPVLLASTDGGRSFSQRWVGSTTGTASMWVPRRGPGALSSIYIAHRGALHRSLDAGTSWTIMATIDPQSNRAVLTGSEAGAPTLYAALRSAGQWRLWRSDDGGTSFQNVHAIGDFWESLCASTLAPDVVMYGGVECWRSADGGASFTRINPWGQYYGNPANRLHADLPGIYCWPDPADPQAEIWYMATDGGLYESRALGLSPSNLSLSGLGVSQYYSTLSSSSDPNLILAGSQDQGYQRGRRQPTSDDGPSTPFDQLISGDYGHLTSSDGTHGLVYSTYPGFILVQEGQDFPVLQFPWLDFPAGSQHAWLPPVVADPLDPERFYFCADRLWSYTRVSGANWSHAQHSTQDFAVGGSYLSALAFAPTDPDRAYAVNNGGRIFVSTDHALTWTQTQSGAPGQHYFYGNAIAVHPEDPLEAAIGGSGYSTAGVIRTLDGGQSWHPLTSGLPNTLVYALAYARDGSGDLFAGTETGAWRWSRASGTWENPMLDQAPITIYWSVEPVGTNIMRYGTYGRGIWDFYLEPEPGWRNYGEGKVSTAGHTPWIRATGTPSLASGNFRITIAASLPQKPGMLLESERSADMPFMGGRLLLAPPIRRGARFTLDVLGSVSLPVTIDPSMIGDTRYYQGWLRDPRHPDGTGVGLSDGLEVTYGP